jgi:hypothetical protein
MSSLAPPPPADPRLAIEIAPQAERCPSCDAVLAGEWCHVCGERRYAPERMSTRHFLAELADDVVGVDSRAVLTLRLLVLKPGELTLEFLRGRRRPYLGPLKLYLVIFALTLFVSSLVPDSTALNGKQQGGIEALYARFVHTLAARRGLSDAAARATLEHSTAQIVSWLSLLIPLIFAVCFFAIFHRRRRWFGEHLVFATHFATFNFLVGLVIIPFQLLLIPHAATAGVALSVAALVPMFIYAMVAVRRVYLTGWPGAVGSALLLFLVLSLAQFITACLALGIAAVGMLWLGV